MTHCLALQKNLINGHAGFIEKKWYKHVFLIFLNMLYSFLKLSA